MSRLGNANRKTKEKARFAGLFYWDDMTKVFGLNTQAALADAPRRGLVVRDFVWIKAKDRDTGDPETIAFWNGLVPVTANVTDPSDGGTLSRDFIAGGALMKVPSIPAGTNLEVRTIRLEFSRLNEGVLNAVRLYDPKMARIQIHRGFFDPTTRALVDPAYCRFDGYINRAPIKIPAAGGEGSVQLECVSQARTLTRTSGKRLSHEMMKERSPGDLFAKYMDVAGDWRIFWGEEETSARKWGDRKEKWNRPGKGRR